MTQAKNLLRTRDVVIALDAAKSFEQPLGKVQIQKFIYLLDALSLLFAILPVRDGYRTYKHGPWDPAIQNAVHALAFRRLVRIVATRTLTGGQITAQYQLTAGGDRLVAHLRVSGAFVARFRAAKEIARRVDGLGWGRLRELVYAEPTYVAGRAGGFGRDLAPAEAFDASTRALVAVIRETLEQGWGGEFVASESTVVDAFFRFLDFYARPGAQAGAIATWS